MINKNFLQEASLLQLSEEIFSTVINDGRKLNSVENLLTEKIKEAETINFILADGLGYENLMSLETSLKDNIKKIINTTFPSSTNVALTTFAMMSHPIDHGIIGYYMYDKSNFGDDIKKWCNFYNKPLTQYKTMKEEIHALQQKNP